VYILMNMHSTNKCQGLFKLGVGKMWILVTSAKDGIRYLCLLSKSNMHSIKYAVFLGNFETRANQETSSLSLRE
jgi:hypothetical protein